MAIFVRGWQTRFASFDVGQRACIFISHSSNNTIYDRYIRKWYFLSVETNCWMEIVLYLCTMLRCSLMIQFKAKLGWMQTTLVMCCGHTIYSLHHLSLNHVCLFCPVFGPPKQTLGIWFICQISLWNRCDRPVDEILLLENVEQDS